MRHPNLNGYKRLRFLTSQSSNVVGRSSFWTLSSPHPFQKKESSSPHPNPSDSSALYTPSACADVARLGWTTLLKNLVLAHVDSLGRNRIEVEITFASQEQRNRRAHESCSETDDVETDDEADDDVETDDEADDDVEEQKKRRAPPEDVMTEVENAFAGIVGLDDLKIQIQKWAKGLLLDERRRTLGRSVGKRRAPHMAFLGNPGTGKTMVARLLGRILHMLGLLPTDRVTEVQRTDLVARYVGQTGPKTRKKIEEAKGGILFVDEAYQLVPTIEGKSWDFGIEALEEIMSFMDSGKVVVIFAGYSEPMKRVITSNEGFNRRVTKFFQFNDYTLEDLAKIAHIKMHNQEKNHPLYGFTLHSSCSIDAIAALIQKETTEKQRRENNAGLVDTMLVNAREHLDQRLDCGCMDVEELTTITLLDLEAGLKLLTQ